MTTLRAKVPFAGCVAMSTYIPGNPLDLDGETREVKLDIPVLQFHGKLDPMVPFERGEKTANIISRLVKEHRYVWGLYIKTYRNSETFKEKLTYYHLKKIHLILREKMAIVIALLKYCSFQQKSNP